MGGSVLERVAAGPHRGQPSVLGQRTVQLNEALAFARAVHHSQKREDLWLGRQPFVEAVRDGSADRQELARWVRQIYCTTRTYGEILRSMSPPPPVGVWTDPWGDMTQLVELAGALGIGPREMAISQPHPATRAVQIWLREHLSNRALHIGAQACWALVEAMSPEAWAHLAEGSLRHFGLTAKQLGYFKIRMKSRTRADRYAANLLTQIAMDDWCSVQETTLLVSRLMVRLY